MAIPINKYAIGIAICLERFMAIYGNGHAGPGGQFFAISTYGHV